MALFQKKRILYYGGCLYNSKLSEQNKLYLKILDKLKIKYVLLNNQVCCGNKLFDLGYDGEARKLARRNLKFLKENKVDKIITSCPECYKVFLQNYGEMLPDWKDENIEVEHICVSILRELINKQKLIKNSKMGEIVFYHDNCYLANYCKIKNEPREILKLLGYELVELEKGCCGACGGMYQSNLKLAEKLANKLFSKVRKAGISKVIVASGDCYLHLKKAAEKYEIEILELSEVVAYGFGLIEEKNE